MIQPKATYLRCEGTGCYDYDPNDTSASGYFPLPCPAYNGKGTFLLTSQNWDISFKLVPPFLLEGEAIGVV